MHEPTAHERFSLFFYVYTYRRVKYSLNIFKPIRPRFNESVISVLIVYGTWLKSST